MNEEKIAEMVSYILMLVFGLELLPGLREWWESAIGKRWKPLALLVLCLVVPLGIQGVECAGYDARTDVECVDPSSVKMWLGMVGLGISAWVISQVGYITLAKPLGKALKPTPPTPINPLMPTVNVTVPIQQIPSTSPVGPGAISEGTIVTPLMPPEPIMVANLIPFEKYSTVELTRMAARIQTIVLERESYHVIGAGTSANTEAGKIAGSINPDDDPDPPAAAEDWRKLIENENEDDEASDNDQAPPIAA